MGLANTKSRLGGWGWTAEVCAESMILHVAQAGGDYLTDAIAAILTPVRQQFYVIEHIGVDEAGWDVYEVVNSAWLPDCDDYQLAASWITIV